MQYCLQDAFRIKIGYETVIENYFNQYMYIRICMVFHSALNINWHKETNKAVLNKQTNKQTQLFLLLVSLMKIETRRN